MDAGNISASTAPSDVLSLIFERTLGLIHRNEQCRFVIVLALVCHSWRATCIDAPNLWSRIGPFVRSYDLVRLYLDRSGNYPLFIDYYETGEDERILPLLAQESERWSDVRLSIPPPFYRYLSSIRGRLPLLRTLFWGYDEDWYDDMATGTNDLDTSQAQEDFAGFKIAPVLTQLSFNCPYLKETFPLPWNQLTHLNCTEIHSSNLYSILLNIPHLSQLTLYRIYNDSIDMEAVVPGDGHTFAPALASLHVTDCDFQIIQSVLRMIPNVKKISIVVWERVRMRDCHTPIMLPILDSLSIRVERSLPYLTQSFKIHAPMLSTLELECDDVMDEDDDEDYSDEELAPVWFVGGCGSAMLRFLMELVQEANCSLTSLKLEMEVDFESTAMESLLRVVPCLEHLEIALVQPEGYDHIPLRAMTPACSTFPRLKTLYLRFPSCDFTFEDVKELLAFVSRSTDLEVKFLGK
ncbi:hypothetical protein F5880DRAFT_1613563 [Lentinula raphanica]|nr:hypothetical protein F5880DRAFT_1613563 [Lentinula raphanica]